MGSLEVKEGPPTLYKGFAKAKHDLKPIMSENVAQEALKRENFTNCFLCNYGYSRRGVGNASLATLLYDFPEISLLITFSKNFVS